MNDITLIILLDIVSRERIQMIIDKKQKKTLKGRGHVLKKFWLSRKFKNGKRNINSVTLGCYH